MKEGYLIVLSYEQQEAKMTSRYFDLVTSLNQFAGDLIHPKGENRPQRAKKEARGRVLVVGVNQSGTE